MPDLHVDIDLNSKTNNVFMKFDNNLAALHGYLCGDGYVSSPDKNYHLVSFTNTEKALINDFEEKFIKTFEMKPSKNIKKSAKRKWKNLLIISSGNKKIHESLVQYGPYYTENWKIPIKFLTKNQLSIWLRAFFDCEGWVELESGKNRRIGLDSKNGKELLKVQNLLRQEFEINSIIKQKKGRNISRLQIFGEENLFRFQKYVGFLHPKKKYLLEKALESFIKYDWKFPEDNNQLKSFVQNLLKEKLKVKRKRMNEVIRVRLNSIIKENLLKVSNILLKFYGIESKVFGPNTNGYGTKYYELSIHKKNSVKKLLKIKLLNNQEFKKLKQEVKN